MITLFHFPNIFHEIFILILGRRKTIHVGLLIENEWSGKSSYQPGDHIGVFAANREKLVNGLMSRLALNRPPLPQGPIQLRVLIEQKGFE